MAKAGELDWSEELNKTDNYAHTPTALWAASQYGGGKHGVDPLNKAEPRLKKGEEPYRPSDEEIRAAIMHNAPKQPTDMEMFGHLLVTEEQIQKKKQDWENSLQKNIDDLNAPINPGNEDADWGSGKSFNSTLTEEERLKRNMFTKE
jgi:hypothetical protein